MFRATLSLRNKWMNYGSVYVAKLDLSFLQSSDVKKLPSKLEERLCASKIGATLPETESSGSFHRVATFQTGNPFPFKLIVDIPCKEPKKLEKYLHVKYEENRVHYEWFFLTDEEVDDIKQEASNFHTFGTISDPLLWKKVNDKLPRRKKKAVPEDSKAETALLSDDSKPPKSMVRSILRNHIMSLEKKASSGHDFGFDREYLNEKDFKIVLAALQNHCESSEKIGVGVEGIFVAKTSLESYCFHVKRIDGSEEDFSYHFCYTRKGRNWGHTYKTAPHKAIF